MPILYNIRTAHEGFIIAKFDDDFNVEAFYNLRFDGKALTCDCPAGVRPTCRHRKMVNIFALSGAIDTSRFYCYETQMWHQPIPTAGEGDDAAGKAAEIAGAAGSLTTEPTQAAQPRDIPAEPEPDPEPESEYQYPAEVTDPYRTSGPNAGEGPGPSTLAVAPNVSPSVSGRGQPAPIYLNQAQWAAFQEAGHDMSQYVLLEKIPAPASPKGLRRL